MERENGEKRGREEREYREKREERENNISWFITCDHQTLKTAPISIFFFSLSRPLRVLVRTVSRISCFRAKKSYHSPIACLLSISERTSNNSIEREEGRERGR